MHILLPLLLICLFAWIVVEWGPGPLVAMAVFVISVPVIWFIVYIEWPHAAIWVALAGGWWLARKAGRAFA